jgi:hypothetical protein
MTLHGPGKNLPRNLSRQKPTQKPIQAKTYPGKNLPRNLSRQKTYMLKMHSLGGIPIFYHFFFLVNRVE